MRELRAAAIAVLAFTLALGLAYPLAMTGASQALFGSSADGSLVERDGKTVGSSLIGQDFADDPGYFQSRPSATEYNPAGTYFNNLGPNQQDLADLLEENVAAYLEREGPHIPGLTAAGIPSDAVTTSASGVDPHISVENARIQANRVADERAIDRAKALELIDEHTGKALLGLGGQAAVNVLELNLALDEEAPR